MPDPLSSQDARLPGEKREVFLSRMLLRLVGILSKDGGSRDLIALRDTLTDDNEAHQRKGRSRPGRQS